MNSPVDTDLLTAVCQIVTTAGKKIEEIRDAGPVTATRKDDDSPVTRADQAADELLRIELIRLLRCGWLSEETADDESRLSEDLLWVVDPLDGTKEFVEGLPQYSVAVALVQNGQPVLGVVHNPATGDMFSALRGAGAYHNDKPIQVSEGNLLLASRSETRRGEFGPFEDDWEIEGVGSIELKLALVAAGEGAVTLSRGPKHEWDVCAGVLIVEEAGGVATDVFGGPLRFNLPLPKVKGILAGAPQAYASALDQMKSIGASDRMDEFADVRSQRSTP